MARTTLADIQLAIKTAQEAGARVDLVRLPPVDHELLMAEVDHTTLKRAEACESLKICGVPVVADADVAGPDLVVAAVGEPKPTVAGSVHLPEPGPGVA